MQAILPSLIFKLRDNLFHRAFSVIIKLEKRFTAQQCLTQVMPFFLSTYRRLMLFDICEHALIEFKITPAVK